MYSSFFPWEFKKDFPTFVKKGSFGIYGLSCYDPFLERIFFQGLPSHFLEGGKLCFLNSSDVTVEWLESNLKTNDFFSSSLSYKVLMSENLSPTAQDYLLEENIDWSERYFFLSFQRENKFYEKLKKEKEISVYKIKPPNFWDYEKLMQFLCEQMSLPLPFRVQKFLVEVISPEVPEYINALKRISLLGRDLRKVTPEEIRGEIEQSRFDSFFLAQLWSQRKYREFYTRLLSFAHHQGEMIKFFSFMQSHLLKICDPSYTEEKKLSQYDKSIKSSAKIWSKEDLRRELRFFGECEILAKERSFELIQKLRLQLIEKMN